MSHRAIQGCWRLIAGALPCAVAAVVVVIIIPVLATNAFPGWRAHPSIIAFALTAVLHALVGTFALRSNRSSGAISVWLGVATLMLGFILLDAAFAFTERPDLRVAVIAIFICAMSDFAATTSVFVMAFMRSRAAGKPIRLFE